MSGLRNEMQALGDCPAGLASLSGVCAMETGKNRQRHFTESMNVYRNFDYFSQLAHLSRGLREPRSSVGQPM